MAVLFAALLTSFIIIQTVFVHSHLLSNGTIITHAHPYNKQKDSSPFKSHHHSNGELCLLGVVTSFLRTGTIHIDEAVVPQFSQRFLVCDTAVGYIIYKKAVSDRAPPMIF